MSSLRGLQAEAPNVTFAHTPSEMPGFGFVSIPKQKAGDGLAAGEIMAKRVGMAKVVIVVDDDIDVLDTLAVLHATGARWQPKGANKVLTGLRGHQLDPSLGDPDRTSKMVIDATRALPEEGGPAVWQQENRALLVAGAPGAFARVDARWAKLVGDWAPPGRRT
jgi:UbiD family decarboxylase